MLDNKTNITEKGFEKQLAEYLRTQIGHSCEILTSKAMLYRIIIDANGEINPPLEKIKDPKRGQSAFETDILIKDKENGAPLVVIELKVRGFSTHDVLTYSAKAMRHKEIYPYLRYGFVVSGQEFIDGKFFIHNIGFDFAFMIKSFSKNQKELVDIIKRQIKISKNIISVLNKSKRVKKYESNINFK